MLNSYADRSRRSTSRRRSPEVPAGTNQSLEAWAENLRANGFSLSTVRHRTRVVRSIARRSGVRSTRLEPRHVAIFFRDGTYKPRTRENYLVAVRMYAEWAGLGDITADLRRVPVPRSVPKPVGEAGLARMLASVGPEQPVYAWIVLGAYLGLRSAESASLKVEDMEENGSGWAVRIVGKGGVERLIPAPPVVVEALLEAIHQSAGRGRLWPKATPSAVQNAVRRVAQGVGVTCSSHQLRHRYGTAVYRVSHDLLMLQKLMGHASPLTTAGYALVDLGNAGDVVGSLPGAGAGDDRRLRAVG